MSCIVRLDSHFINQIAAGEVIERPASVLKELMENAIDAGASALTIELEEGGKTFIGVSDNGSGMTLDDLLLSIERHTTSKLTHADLFSISTLGFRGEALSSITSIARVYLKTNPNDTQTLGHALNLEWGKIIAQSACHHQKGTSVEVSDLFHAIPARLHFLKSSSSEQQACLEWVDRLALIYPHVYFCVLQKKNQKKLRFYKQCTSHEDRIKDFFDASAYENLRFFEVSEQDHHVKAWFSLPTLNRNDTRDCYLYINGRFVKDKMVYRVVKDAYGDVLSHGRYPIFVLDVRMPSHLIDVNVHPTKQEIRLKDPRVLRGILFHALKNFLSNASKESSSHLPHAFLKRVDAPFAQPSSSPSLHFQKRFSKQPFPQSSQFFSRGSEALVIDPDDTTQDDHGIDTLSESHKAPLLTEQKPFETSKNEPSLTPLIHEMPDSQTSFGVVKAQLFETYIICEQDDYMILIDQHAAHERVLYEQMKQSLDHKSQHSQKLIIPYVLTLSKHEINDYLPLHNALINIGFMIDQFANTLSITHIPEVFATWTLESIREMISDILNDIAHGENHEYSHMHERILKKLATKACHKSIKSGDTLTKEQMEELLVLIEKTPNSAQCNHGRPTFVKFSKKDLERLFERL